ncbi:MAG: HD domain-containing protein [Clostridium sp.]|jgi:putative nucleotidyltransferase with HDIG domain|uniref:HDIG domain-containing metalloprotein n=1 Tax=Clostridium sp. TaxID=1506 RepID=UPI0025BD9161|nr:HDIG domain-containing metalloprotein [Clostridium sp.]MCH3964434.1 HD domain-containing protein [Clostridium sp.]MCI1715609.1 HD domain-containing protein [Clostridium sp.]MCI1799599.1 HD domain-containing protein [Clostridium sp.]MCI1813793.1 HD domain-containing protein [Clostridium sp.]MCI1870412.1 HD domain-containing protein [Clostridium sp.]
MKNSKIFDKLYFNIERHLLEDSQPSFYLEQICNDSSFDKYPFDMLYKLKITEQSPKYHPEGNVWNHTMLVVDEAANVKIKSRDQRVFMWAALLHDIGKSSTTRNRKGKITSYDHDKVGARLVNEFLSCFTDDIIFIDKVSWLVRYHMNILFVTKNLPFADIDGMKQHTDVMEVALLGFCDRMGRLNSSRQEEWKNIMQFLKNIARGE